MQGTPRDPVSARAFRGHVFVPVTEPTLGLRYVLTQAPMPTTLARLVHSIEFSFASVMVEIRRGPDPNATGTVVLISTESGPAQTTTTVFNDPDIPADEYVWANILDAINEPTLLNLNMEFE